MIKNAGYKYFIATNSVPWGDPVVSEIVDIFMRRRGIKPSATTVNHYLWRLLFERDRWGTTVPGAMRDLDYGTPNQPKDMTYGHHRGNFLYPFFGPARVGKGELELRAYFQQLQDRGDTDVILNAEQDDWMGRENHPEWGAGFSVYDSESQLEFFVRMLDVAYQEYGLRPHVGIIDQPTLRRFYDFRTERGWSQPLDGRAFPSVKSRTQYLMHAIKGKATLAMPSWELGEVMSNGSRRSHEVLEARLVEWASWIHEIDPEVWVGIHHADGLRGGINFYSAMVAVIGHRACRYMQYSQDDSTLAIADKTKLIRDVAVDTWTSYCVMEHSSPVRLRITYTEAEARVRANAARLAGADGPRFDNFMNGYPS